MLSQKKQCTKCHKTIIDHNMCSGCYYTYMGHTARNKTTDYQDFVTQNASIEERKMYGLGTIWSNEIQCDICEGKVRSRNKNDINQCRC